MMTTKTCITCATEKPVEAFVTANQCKACKAARDKRRYDAKREAILVGKKAYVAANREVLAVKNKARYEANKDAVLAQKREYFMENREALILKFKQYYAKNRGVVREAQSNYRQENLALFAARNAKTRAARMKRVPQWLTTEQRAQIEAVYAHAKECEMLTGDAYHVDHIIPLQGKTMSGLHTPWNLQVLPADVNIGKKNRYTGPDAW